MNQRQGDKRRLLENQMALASEIMHGENDIVFLSVRNALERGWTHTFLDILDDFDKKKV